MVWGSLGQATGGYPSLSESRRGGAGKGGLCRGCFEGWGVSEWAGVVIGWVILVLCETVLACFRVLPMTVTSIRYYYLE